MNDAEKFLLDWAENFFVSKDAFVKKITSIEHNDGLLIIYYKDKTERIKVATHLDTLTDIEKVSLVITLNNRRNMDYLVKEWSRLAQLPELRIYFINPFSSTEKKWVINPSVHQKICEPDSLKIGVISLFESVEPLTEEMLHTLLKGQKVPL